MLALLLLLPFVARCFLSIEVSTVSLALQSGSPIKVETLPIEVVTYPMEVGSGSMGLVGCFCSFSWPSPLVLLSRW